METDDDDTDASELEEYRICHGCIGEEHLKAEVKKDGEKAECAYCEKTAKTISIGELAERVETAFDEHYSRTSTEPDDMESMMLRDKESSYSWDRHGEQVAFVIAEAAGLDEEPAEHVRKVLHDKHYDMDAAAAGEEGPFDADAHYEEKDVEDHELRASWRFFEQSLKTQSRLFNREAESVLDSLFEGLSEHKTKDGNPVIVEAGPGKPVDALFRARTFTSDETKLQAALSRPDIGIGPPPSAAASAGRMNARGISVFYGSTDPQIALAEVRPPVGSRVVVARFQIIRPVRLLNVEALREIYVTGSVFDSGFARQLEKAKFLERLSHRISMPIMPEDELSDYLPTQAIADYLANRSDPQIDGIIFPSVQNGSKGVNVVLFHKSSRVEALEFPKGTKISASIESNTEDGPEPDYYVWEEVPKETAKKKEDDDGPFSLSLFTQIPDENADVRTPFLRLDIASVEVHHVNRVTFDTSAFAVTRHRHEGDYPF